jgi:hypothetical protein
MESSDVPSPSPAYVPVAPVVCVPVLVVETEPSAPRFVTEPLVVVLVPPPDELVVNVPVFFPYDDTFVDVSEIVVVDCLTISVDPSAFVVVVVVVVVVVTLSPSDVMVISVDVSVIESPPGSSLVFVVVCSLVTSPGSGVFSDTSGGDVSDDSVEGSASGVPGSNGSGSSSSVNCGAGGSVEGAGSPVGRTGTAQ